MKLRSAGDFYVGPIKTILMQLHGNADHEY